MYTKLSIATIAVLLFGLVVSAAVGSVNGGWLSGLTPSGDQGFWSPDTPQSSSPQMVITGNGNVGIGTVSPWHKLEVTGDICSIKNGQTICLDGQKGTPLYLNNRYIGNANEWNQAIQNFINGRPPWEGWSVHAESYCKTSTVYLPDSATNWATDKFCGRVYCISIGKDSVVDPGMDYCDSRNPECGQSFSINVRCISQ